MKYTLDNPVNPLPIESLEKREFKDQNFFNLLLKRNLKKIKRECKEDNKEVNIICIGQRIFY
jgi:hypothetical protein